MKHKGKRLSGLNRGTVTVTRQDDSGELVKCTLVLAPLESGWHQLMRSRGIGDFPVAPTKPLKDGDKLVLNPHTGNVDFYEDTEDPEYTRLLHKFSRRFFAMKLKNHLRTDPDIEFEAVEPKEKKDSEGWTKYADDVAKEIEDFGLTETEVQKISEYGNALSLSLDPDAGLKDFLRRTKSRE